MAFGFRITQASRLEVLPRTISEVAKKLGLSLSATSQIVARLERARLLRRTERREDKRERHVSLPAKGLALLDAISMSRAARFQDAFQEVPLALARRFSIVLQDVLNVLRERS